MVSKNIIKLVHSLELKKNRKHEGLFVAEGPKVVGDIMKKQAPAMIIATNDWIEANQACLKRYDDMQGRNPVRLIEATEEELRKTSFLIHPQQVIGLFHIPENKPSTPLLPTESLCLALDGVQDPGNLGTIIRIADWFGIDTILCSNDTADVYNPKVIQATMGSIARVNIIYADLEKLLDEIGNIIPVYGTLLDGDNIYKQELTTNGIIVMGNEGNGISPQIRKKINRRLLIPDFSEGDTAESLNVAIATAITCSEFKRRSS